MKNNIFIKGILYFFISFFIFNLITSLLAYNNVISNNTISIINFFNLIISLFIFNFHLSYKLKFKGYLIGLFSGLLISISFIIISIILKSFESSNFIYYLIITLSSILSSMIGKIKKP